MAEAELSRSPAVEHFPPVLVSLPCLWMVQSHSPPSVLVHMLIVSRTPSWMYPELVFVGVPLSLRELESPQKAGLHTIFKADLGSFILLEVNAFTLQFPGGQK